MNNCKRFFLIFLIIFVPNVPIKGGELRSQSRFLGDQRFEPLYNRQQRQNEEVRQKQAIMLEAFNKLKIPAKETEKEEKCEKAELHDATFREFIARCIPFPDCLLNIMLDYLKAGEESLILFPQQIVLITQDKTLADKKFTQRYKEALEEWYGASVTNCDRDGLGFGQFVLSFSFTAQKMVLSYNRYSFALVDLKNKTQHNVKEFLHYRKQALSPQARYITSLCLGEYGNNDGSTQTIESLYVVRLSNNKYSSISLPDGHRIKKVNFVKDDSFLIVTSGFRNHYNITVYNTDKSCADGHWASLEFNRVVLKKTSFSLVDIDADDHGTVAAIGSSSGQYHLNIWKDIFAEESPKKIDLTLSFLEAPKLSFTDNNKELVIGDMYRNTCIYNVNQSKFVDSIVLPEIFFPKEWPEKGVRIETGKPKLDRIVLTEDGKIIRLIKLVANGLEVDRRYSWPYFTQLIRSSRRASAIVPMRQQYCLPYRNVKLTRSGHLVSVHPYCGEDGMYFSRVEVGVGYDIER